MTFETIRPHLRPGLAAAFSLALGLAATSPALALNDDGRENVFSSILNLVLPDDKEQPSIEYRERAPLVVPPNRQALPQPQPPAQQRAKAWPKDQEIARREAERAAAGKPRVDEVWNPVSRSELDRVRTGSPQQPRPAGENCNDPLARVCNQEALWSSLKGRSAVDERRDLVPGQEAPRQALTDPPAGYRKPTTVQKYTFEVRREDDITDARQQAIRDRQTREQRER
jgi:hypothetical protein